MLDLSVIYADDANYCFENTQYVGIAGSSLRQRYFLYVK